MKNTCPTIGPKASTFLVLLCLLFTGSPAFLLAQEQQMKAGGYNLTSFSEPFVSSATEADWKRYNDPSYYDHPEFGKLPFDAPCVNCVENLSKRKADERYFINVDRPSEFYQQKSLGLLCEEKNGDWLTINHHLRPDGNGNYRSAMHRDPAGIEPGSKRAYIHTAEGKTYFNQWQLYTRTGESEVLQAEADWSHFTAGDDGIYITDVFPGIDAELIVFRGAIKTNFILKTNQFGTFGELIFRDRYDTPGASSVHSEYGWTESGDGAVFIRSGMTDVLQMNESVLFAKEGPKELVQAGSYRIHENNVDVVVPFNWINDNIGNYHLVVDPLVTATNTLAQASITGSMYNTSCGWDNSCDYTLTVARPANSTITDATFSMVYTATGACWLEDGAMRFSYGSCVSPANPLYWTCQLIGGGTCTGTNLSFFNTMGSCFPASGCTPQNINFTFKFYRRCYGPTGCNNSCIGAGSPLSITVTGRTLEYTNTVTPITVSSTTICQGQSITANTSASYGVPNYTYNWSLNASGTPSVGTGAPATINFPTAGTFTLYSIVTDACGNQITASRTITVNPAPTVTVNSPTICAGGTATLNATGAGSYTWSPATNLSATTGATVTSTTPTTITYTVTGTASGCTGTATATVTVNPIPVVTVNSPTICAGDPATLTATGADAYTWSPTTALSPTSGSPVTATPAATTTYTVTGTTNGCSGTATSTVTVNPDPVVTVNSPTICPGDVATLNATGAASFTWSPATDLSATTGATVTSTTPTTTTYTVTGTTGNCSGTATATVTVAATPVVTVNSETICTGASAILTATGAGSYTWSPATGLSATTGTTVTATPATTTTYTVTGTTGNCSGTATSTVTVNPNPVVTVNSETICAGASATLTATGADSYSWSPATNLSSTIGSPVTANPPATTTYVVTGTTNGCTGTANAIVTVNPNPVVSVNSPTICAGSTATLNAAGAGSFSWSPATNLSATTGATVTSTTPVTTTYTVTGTTNGCSGTATATVTVNPIPVPSAANNGPLCPGAQLNLTASGGGAGATYSWTGPSFSSPNQNPTIAAVTNANAGTYTVTVTENGCSATASTTVTVFPVASTAINPAGPFCIDNGVVTLTAASPGGTWSGTGITDPNAGTFDPAAAQQGSHVVTYTLPGNCTSASTATIVVNELPTVAFSANVVSGCEPLVVQFTDNSTPAGQQVLWNFGDGQTSTTPGVVTHTYNGNNCFDVTLTITDANGCSGSLSETNMICVTERPEAAFSVGDASMPVTDPVFQFSNSSTGADTYLWNFGDGTNSSATSPSHTYPQTPGNYTVTLTATSANGCFDVTTQIVKVYEDLLFFIPNAFTPNGDEHNNEFKPVFTSGFDPYSFSMFIYNRWGEVVFESHDVNAAWDGTYDGKVVKEGAYTWTIQFRDSESDKKYKYDGHFMVLR